MQTSIAAKTMLIFLAFTLCKQSAIAQNSYRLAKAPFYKSFDKKAVLTDHAIAYLPVAVDKQTTAEFFYQHRDQLLVPLLSEINHYLESIEFTLISSDDLTATSKGAPYLFVGSAESVIAPPSAEMLKEEFDKYPPMVIHIDKPSKEWKAQLTKQLNQEHCEYALIIWIGFNEYPKANKGLFKKKVVLGTGYEPEIRFLSDELGPVEVLQLSGLLLDSSGKIIRGGSEAFLYEDSPFWVSSVQLRRFLFLVNYYSTME